jgi:hypothetical protein
MYCYTLQNPQTCAGVDETEPMCGCQDGFLLDENDNCIPKESCSCYLMSGNILAIGMEVEEDCEIWYVLCFRLIYPCTSLWILESVTVHGFTFWFLYPYIGFFTFWCKFYKQHENQQGNKENIESTMNMKDKMIMKWLETNVWMPGRISLRWKW